jgi:hypothetical protein
MLLPGNGDIESIDVCCPICLGSIGQTSTTPALELSCKHIFCANCIGQWIHQQQVVMPSSSNHHVAAAAAGGKAVHTSWHCPVCRNEF